MTELFVRPVGEKRVVRPETGKVLPPEGARVPDTTFWRRRLASKAVVFVRFDAEANKAEVKKGKA